MNRIHIVGRKNSGKTTLIVELVDYLTNQGLQVGTIKHTHHNHELDTPGKDSFRHRKAGARAVGILSSGMNAIFWPCDHSNENQNAKYEQFDSMMSQCDLVLVEGDSTTDALKIEVFRAENGDQPMASSDSEIQAVVTDDPLEINVVTWPRADLAAIARNIELHSDLHKTI